jgi:hypothetical protein
MKSTNKITYRIVKFVGFFYALLFYIKGFNIIALTVVFAFRAIILISSDCLVLTPSRTAVLLQL